MKGKLETIVVFLQVLILLAVAFTYYNRLNVENEGRLTSWLNSLYWAIRSRWDQLRYGDGAQQFQAWVNQYWPHPQESDLDT